MPQPPVQPPAQPPAQPLDDARAGAVGRVFDRYDPPLWLITSAHGERRGGLIATFAVRASIVPSCPRMVIGVAKHHHTWGLIEGSNGFALHLLHAHQIELVRRFGLASGHQTDKFAGLPHALTPGGQPLIAEALAWLDCRCEARMDTGDRTLYLAAITDGATIAGAAERTMTVQSLFAAVAPADRSRLDALYARDGQIDGAAILAWRGLAP